MKISYSFFVCAVLALLSSFSYAQDWVQIGEDINGEAMGDNFGNAIDISADGNVIAIGGWNNDGNGTDAGHVRILENNNGTWTQVGDDIDGNVGEKKGFAVSLNDTGNIVALSTPYVNNNTGKVSIYKNVNGVWTQMGEDIYGIGEYYYGGITIVLSPEGNMIAISNHANYGHIRLYEYGDDKWTFIKEIEGTLFNEQLGGGGLEFNHDGSILAARSHPRAHVRVFKKNTSVEWEQVGDPVPDAGSSFSLSMDSLTVAVGIDNWFGTAKVYQFSNGAWVQKGGDLGGWFTNTGYGGTVELNSDGTMLLVSAIGDNFSTGTVVTYLYNDGEWTSPIDAIKGVNNLDIFGKKLCLNSNDSILAVSAPRGNGNMEGPGFVRIYRYQELLPINVDTSISVCDNELPYTFGTQSLNSEGTYVEVFEAANGVDSTVTLTLSVNTLPNPVFTNNADTLTSSDTYSLYQWYDQDGLIEGATSKQFIIEKSGTYSLKVTNDNGCSGMSGTMDIILTNVNGLINNQCNLMVFPNPSKGIFRLKFVSEEPGKYNIRLFNALGQIQFAKEIFKTENTYEETYNLSHLKGGIYFVKVSNNDVTKTEMIIFK